MSSSYRVLPFEISGRGAKSEVHMGDLGKKTKVECNVVGTWAVFCLFDAFID